MIITNKSSLNLDPDPNQVDNNSDKFNMKELCGSCQNQSCCTGFDAPFLFEKDIKRLEERGFLKEDCVEKIRVANLNVNSLKKKENSTNCIFWDEKKKLCKIYKDRPFDCKMFPFDIIKRDNQYMWIVFSCNPNSDWQWAEEHLQRLENDPQFPEIMKNIDIFHHTLETEFSEKHSLPYVIIRKVKTEFV